MQCKNKKNIIFKVKSTISQLYNISINFTPRKPSLSKVTTMNRFESCMQFLSITMIAWNIHPEFYIFAHIIGPHWTVHFHLQ